LDYLGVTGESQTLTFILAALALVVIAFFGRARQLENG
jgi:LPXTG-motif cell wall-anchored protein